MTNQKSSTGGGVGFTGLLAIVFIALKLMGYISWSWVWVLSPLWIPIVLLLLLILFLVIVEVLS